MTEWWSIEVFDAEFSATQWRDSYGSQLVESAVAHGVTDWEWHLHRWGIVLELAFPEDAQWLAFRALPAVQAALDAVPDPVNGLLTYRGRGGGAGTTAPRKPRPLAGAGQMALPEPDDEQSVDLTSAELSDASAGPPGAGSAAR
jgi:hypothetical protein